MISILQRSQLNATSSICPVYLGATPYDHALSIEVRSWLLGTIHTMLSYKHGVEGSQRPVRIDISADALLHSFSLGYTGSCSKDSR